MLLTLLIFEGGSSSVQEPVRLKGENKEDKEVNTIGKQRKSSQVLTPR